MPKMDEFTKYRIREIVAVGAVVGVMGSVFYYATKTPEDLSREPVAREGVITSVYENVVSGRYSLEVTSLDTPATTSTLSAIKMHGGINIDDLLKLDLSIGDTIKYRTDLTRFLSANNIEEIRRKNRFEQPKP